VQRQVGVPLRSRSAEGVAVKDESVVDQYMARLKHPLKAEIEALRAIILGADPRIREAVKWNAPSYFIVDHFATFNLRSAETVRVVLHRGAKAKDEASAPRIDDPSGMLTWAARDRCVATFSDMKTVRSQKRAFTAILRQWIHQL
jgi:hypothetical protein